MRCASCFRCPWLKMGLLPPEESIRMSDQNTPVEICIEATCVIAILSCVLPNSLGLIRNTCSGLTTIRVGKKKFPRVKRLAVKLSVLDVGWAMIRSRNLSRQSEFRRLNAKCWFLHPFQSAFFPDPDVAHDQNDKEDQHLN